MGRKAQDILYGIHTVRHAVEIACDKIIEVFLQDEKKYGKELKGIVSFLEKENVTIQRVPVKTLDKLSAGALHQGIVIKMLRTSPAQKIDLKSLLQSDKKLLILILDGIQDPHNLGACLRSANAAGVDAVILSKDRTAPLNATVSKVASGGAEATPVVVVTNLVRAIRQMQEAGVWVVGMAAESKQSLYELDMQSSTAIVVGSEGEGLRENTRKHCDYIVKLPMHGIVDSLNVSVATGICLFEALRQRDKKTS